MLFGGGTRRDEEFAAQVAVVEGAIAEAIAALIDVEELTGEQRRQLAHGLVGLAEGASRLWMDERRRATRRRGRPPDGRLRLARPARAIRDS